MKYNIGQKIIVYTTLFEIIDIFTLENGALTYLCMKPRDASLHSFPASIIERSNSRLVTKLSKILE